MSLISISNFGSTVSVPGAQPQNVASPGESVQQQFLDYLKEPVAQRMIDAWLKAHGLSEQAMQNMPPQQREAIEKQMAEDIKNQARQKIESKLTQSLSVLS